MRTVVEAVSAEVAEMCKKGESGVPEQHFGPLIAGQATPGLVAVNSRGGTLGNIVLDSAHCAAHVTTWRTRGVKKKHACSQFHRLATQAHASYKARQTYCSYLWNQTGSDSVCLLDGQTCRR